MLPAALALPPVETTNGLNENDITAYNVCLEFEKSAQADSVALIHARILGYLIIHSPSGNARHKVVKVMHSCAQDHAKLFQLGQAFMYHFIRPFKKSNGEHPTPQILLHLSC
ncbi:uncharacterized protein ARMOST_17957 [Armillaria ostoyae]|uniref:Uncharacterized protein n=1 Tax=Armillaria ostoyae TaxID=47428 RepID=A0A284S0J2_ARMOS|nr:uncharacterized protein ARMOST_17957 [Armillaria ostoyae]